MITLQMDMIQSMGLAVVILLIGKFLKKKVTFFETYCIPGPVIGGFLFAIINLFLYETNFIQFNFDTTLQSFFMIMFFTSVGFNASFKVLKKGGKKVILFFGVASLLVVFQNIVAIFLAKLINVPPLLALMTGSTPMTGGHGTSAAIAPLIENLGIEGANTVAISAATFGLVSGSMMGGPVADFIIRKKKLLPEKDLEKHIYTDDDIDENVTHKIHKLDSERFGKAFSIILIAMAIGSYLSILLKHILPGLNFPEYIGSMLVAACIRNISDYTNLVKAPTQEISVLEEVALNLFLSMALMSLKLWELSALAIPMIILLLGQVVLMFFYLLFVTFPVMGGDYDAAVMAAGHCGFGLGATPNGISNMKSVCEKYSYSKVAFFVVPLVGALFIDFTNISIITLFIEFLT